MDLQEIISMLETGEENSLLVGRELLTRELSGNFVKKEEIEGVSRTSFEKAQRLKDIVNLFVSTYAIPFDELEEIGYSKLEIVKKLVKDFPSPEIILGFIERSRILTFSELKKEVGEYIKKNKTPTNVVMSAEDMLVDQVKDKLASEWLTRRSKVNFLLALYISTLDSESLAKLLETIKVEEERFYREPELDITEKGEDNVEEIDLSNI